MSRPRTYVALLRGINLGARNKVSMSDLRDLFVALEAEDVTTYLRSGNVVFRRRGAGGAELTNAIEQRIRRDLGVDVTVLLRTEADLERVVTRNPFAKRDSSTLHVTFLAGAPGRSRAAAIDPGRYEPDELRLVGSEVYLHCPNGYGRSKLSNTFFEKQLGVAATTRNWKTVTQLAELAG